MRIFLRITPIDKGKDFSIIVPGEIRGFLFNSYLNIKKLVTLIVIEDRSGVYFSNNFSIYKVITVLTVNSLEGIIDVFKIQRPYEKHCIV
jgi:hypothetical protein